MIKCFINIDIFQSTPTSCTIIFLTALIIIYCATALCNMYTVYILHATLVAVINVYTKRERETSVLLKDISVDCSSRLSHEQTVGNGSDSARLHHPACSRLLMVAKCVKGLKVQFYFHPRESKNRIEKRAPHYIHTNITQSK